MNNPPAPVLNKADRKRLRAMKMNRQIAEIQEKWLPYANRHEEKYAFRCMRDGTKYFFDSPEQAKSIGAFNYNEEMYNLWKERISQLNSDKSPKPLWMDSDPVRDSASSRVNIIEN